jgi:hypothetical protein
MADFFRRFAAGGPNKRKRVNGNREVGKHLAQGARLEIPYNAPGKKATMPSCLSGRWISAR